MKRKQRKQYPNTSLKKEKLKTENACKSHAQFEDNGRKMYTIIMNVFYHDANASSCNAAKQ